MRAMNRGREPHGVNASAGAWEGRKAEQAKKNPGRARAFRRQHLPRGSRGWM